MADRNGYTASQASALYLTDGGSDDWLYGERGIFAFTYEMYPTSYSPGFYPPGSIIEQETTRNRSAIEYFLGIADRPRKAVDDGLGDTTSPAVTLSGPAAGAYVSGDLQVTAQATDDVGVTLVEFILNGATVAIDKTAPYELELDRGAGRGAGDDPGASFRRRPQRRRVGKPDGVRQRHTATAVAARAARICMVTMKPHPNSRCKRTINAPASLI